MAQWIKYLPPKSKDRCSDPQNPCKKARHSSTCMQCVHMCANPVLPWGTGRQKPHNVWKHEGQPASGNKRPRFKQHGRQDWCSTQSCPLFSVHVYVCTCTLTHTQTHTHTHTHTPVLCHNICSIHPCGWGESALQLLDRHSLSLLG